MPRIFPRYCFTAALISVNLMLAAPARAEWAALSWDACGAGVLAKTFSCESNTGQDRLVVSALRDSVGELTQGYVCTVEIVFDGPAVPPWWHTSVGECRSRELEAPAGSQPEDAQCHDEGNFAAGVLPNTYGPAANRLTVTFAGASPSEARFVPHVESFVAALRLGHAKSLGPGACSGCATPACVILRSVEFFDSNHTDPVSMPIPDATSMLAWQGTLAHCIASPVRNWTWGSIKRLYR